MKQFGNNLIGREKRSGGQEYVMSAAECIGNILFAGLGWVAASGITYLVWKKGE